MYRKHIVYCVFVGVFLFAVKMKNGRKSCVSIYVLIYIRISNDAEVLGLLSFEVKSIPNVYIGKFRFTEYYIYGNRKVLRGLFCINVVAGFRISFTFFPHFVYFYLFVCFFFLSSEKSREIRSFSINSSIFALVLLHK